MIADKYKTLFVIFGLTIAVLAVFWQVGEFSFVNYDDDYYVSKNEHISSGLTAKNIAWVFTSAHGGNWHPLTGLSHVLDCEFFNLNPGRHHLVNLAIHLVNTLLLFVILRRVTNVLWPSAFVAVLFALHPLHAESVAWISERKDVLSTLFWFLTMAAYFHYAKNPKLSRYVLTFVLFAMGLMAKPMLVTLPFVLLLLDYWPLERFGKKSLSHLLWEKVPLFILAAVSCMITIVVQSQTGALAGVKQFPLFIRICNAVVSYIRYIEKLFVPVDLAVFYPHAADKLVYWQILGSIALLIGITIWVVRVSGRSKYLFAGWFWYIGTLVPVIGLVQVGEQSMADRYTYIPFIGLFIIIVWGANDLLAKWKYKQPVSWVLSLVATLILSVLTWQQLGYWRDSVSLFSHAVVVTNGNYVAFNNLGNAYADKGELDHAISDFNKAIEINHGYADAYFNRGNIYKSKNQYDPAITDYTKVVEINPRYAEAYYNRAIAYKSRGDFEHAISDYSKAAEINPKDPDIYINRGNAYKEKSRLVLAISDYNKAIEINPGYSLAYFNKASVCELAGRKKEAIEAYKAFIQYATDQYASYIETAKKKIRDLSQ